MESMMEWLCSDAPQHAHHDWLEIVAKTVAKHTQKEQAINTEIVKAQYLVCSINKKKKKLPK